MSFNNQTAVTLTAGGTFDVNTTPQIKPGSGRPMAFFCEGTFDGATVKLQHKITNLDDYSNYVDVGEHTTLTANGGGVFISPFSALAVTVLNAGASTSVRVVIKPLES